MKKFTNQKMKNRVSDASRGGKKTFPALFGFRVLLLLSPFVFFACRSQQTENSVQEEELPDVVLLTPAQYKNAGIVTGSLADKDIASVLKLNGKIDLPPQNLVSVSAPLGGYLRSTALVPGLRVAKGQVIARMEDPQYIQLQQDYLTARSKYEFAKADFERQKTLSENLAASEKNMQLARAEAASQQVLMNALAEQLRLININPAKVSAANISRSTFLYAPISGFVSKVNVSIGRYINPSEIMFEIIDPANIVLSLQVFERDIRKIFPGQKLMAYSNADPEKKYAAEVVLINKDIATEGISGVRCRFLTYDAALLPGMYMNAELDVNVKAVKALPEDAIVSFDGKRFIFIQTNERRFEMKEVHTGNTELNYTTIVGGDTLSDKKIVIKGAYPLLMQLKNKAE